jgi:mannose/cellobiose epimerase-like protein (N-acyl-D-glucosamine 2-epimerase family)
MSLPPDLTAALARLKLWLTRDAYPIWWERGADRLHGGFYDRLDLNGDPVDEPKRLRVQARHAWSYAIAPDFGWTGPSEAACRHGLEFLIERYRRPDGLYRTLVALDGSPLGDTVDLYDQAFVLLVLAAAHTRFGDAGYADEAVSLRERLGAFCHPLGGFAEAPGQAQPLLSNPNMHLFESFIAWSAISGGHEWGRLAADEARLAMRRLIDAETGALGEEFEAGWTLPADPAARQVWPGHQFEWAWLLMAWNAGDPGALRAALRLIDIGERCGVARNSAIFALDGTLEPTDRRARLWSQTERIKATALAAVRTGDGGLARAAVEACEDLETYLAVPTPGLWRDWKDEAGAFVDEPAPASSFYHIVCAIAELERLASGGA